VGQVFICGVVFKQLPHSIADWIRIQEVLGSSNERKIAAKRKIIRPKNYLKESKVIGIKMV
jgi:hypothetical protein